MSITSSTPSAAEQQDRQPGVQGEMDHRPEGDERDYIGSGKLKGRVALVTGGDSGIGRAVAIAFAKEGADLMVVYLDEHRDANHTRAAIEREGRRCETMSIDLGREASARLVIEQTIAKFGRLDILVNNAGEQYPQGSLADISAEQLERTFRSNIFSMFFLCKAALPHLASGARIINTSSVTAYRGSAHLLDYSSTKGAIVGFTRSLAKQLAPQGILVNGVAPGPIWTPLIPSTFNPQEVAQFGKKTPLGRPGQPNEVAGCYVFLASDDASYMSGQFLHPNGGEVVNG